MTNNALNVYYEADKPGSYGGAAALAKAAGTTVKTGKQLLSG